VIYNLFFTAQAWASSAAGEHHAPSIHDIWFPLGNFLIYAFVIARYALPPVRAFLKSRQREVLATIEETAAKKQQAEAFVEEYRARLAGLDKEVAALLASLRDDGETLKTRLLEEAKMLAARIREDARLLADQELNVARQKLLEEMADRAEAAARELAQRNISAADQERLVEEFIQNIGQAR
jgi:F-type H+-transporting ATPase subunit b